MITTKTHWTSVICIVLAVTLSTVSNRVAAADEPHLKRPTLENPDPNGVIEWTRKVYSNGKWNATPDVAHWRGNYYVCINKGNVHNGMDGPAIVLRSSDLKKWDLVYTTTNAPANGSAVDCKLLALRDRLILYYVYMDRRDAGNYSETRVVYTGDGKSWSASQRVYEPGHNFWKPKLHDGLVYVASDYINAGRDGRVSAADENNPKLFRIDLLRSKDGLRWEKVGTIQKDAPWSITETSLVFRPDGELWAFTRQDFLSRSRPPYKDWTNDRAHIMGGGIAGPAMIGIGNDVYLAGRFYSYLAEHGPQRGLRSVRIHRRLADAVVRGHGL